MSSPDFTQWRSWLADHAGYPVKGVYVGWGGETSWAEKKDDILVNLLYMEIEKPWACPWRLQNRLANRLLECVGTAYDPIRRGMAPDAIYQSMTIRLAALLKRSASRRITVVFDRTAGPSCRPGIYG
jgi:hypothetical protein